MLVNRVLAQQLILERGLAAGAIHTGAGSPTLRSGSGRGSSAASRGYDAPVDPRLLLDDDFARLKVELRRPFVCLCILGRFHLRVPSRSRCWRGVSRRVRIL